MDSVILHEQDYYYFFLNIFKTNSVVVFTFNTLIVDTTDYLVLY